MDNTMDTLYNFQKHDIFVVRNITTNPSNYTNKTYRQAIIHIRKVNYVNTEIEYLRVQKSLDFRFIFTDEGFWDSYESFDIEVEDIEIVRKLDMDMTGIGSYTKIAEKLKLEFAEYLI